MIEPEIATRWRSPVAFDRVAAVLIGIVAIVAAILAIQQAHTGMAGTRAQVMGARLTADAAAHINASAVASTADLAAQQQALVLGMTGISRQIQGTIAGNDDAVAVGTAIAAAGERLRAVIASTAATTAGSPVDAYARGLIRATDDDLRTQVTRQNDQVDIAADQGARQLKSVLGLSLVTLAGVLAGISAVLGRGRTGWLVLLTAWLVAGGAVATVVAGLL